MKHSALKALLFSMLAISANVVFAEYYIGEYTTVPAPVCATCQRAEEVFAYHQYNQWVYQTSVNYTCGANSCGCNYNPCAYGPCDYCNTPVVYPAVFESNIGYASPRDTYLYTEYEYNRIDDRATADDVGADMDIDF